MLKYISFFFQLKYYSSFFNLIIDKNLCIFVIFLCIYFKVFIFGIITLIDLYFLNISNLKIS